MRRDALFCERPRPGTFVPHLTEDRVPAGERPSFAGLRCPAEERIADQSVAKVAQRPQRSDGRCLSDGGTPRAGEPNHGNPPTAGGRCPAWGLLLVDAQVLREGFVAFDAEIPVGAFEGGGGETDVLDLLGLAAPGGPGDAVELVAEGA